MLKKIMNKSVGKVTLPEKIPQSKDYIVFIIDDEPDIGTILKLHIEDFFDGEIYVFENTKSAFELIKGGKIPHLIICDVLVKDESGFNFRNRLLSEKINIPFLFITGLGGDEDDDESYTILSKPVQADELKEKVFYSFSQIKISA